MTDSAEPVNRPSIQNIRDARPIDRDLTHVHKPGWIRLERRALAARRVADTIRSALLNRTFGDRLPSDSEIARDFMVSRNTVRTALDLLRDEGVIERLRGSGSFVRASSAVLVPVPNNAWRSVGEETRPRLRYEPIAADLIPAAPALARQLEVEEGAMLVLLQRMTYLDDQPFSTRTSFHPGDLAEGLLDADLTRRPLELLTEVIAPLTFGRSRSRLMAIPADETAAEELGIPLGAPVLFNEHVRRSSDGRVIDLTYLRTRGDRYAVTVDYGDDDEDAREGDGDPFWSTIT